MVPPRKPDVLQIVMLPPRPHALLRARRPRIVPLLVPRKTSLNWFIPALVNSSVGSFAGTSEEECTRLCPLPSKNRKKSSRIWLPERLIISTKFISATQSAPPTSPSSTHARPSVFTSFFHLGNINDIASPSAFTTIPNTSATHTSHRSPPKLNTPTTATAINNPHALAIYE